MEEDDLVRRMIPDPSQPTPDAVTIVGFLGKGLKPRVWRLYLNPELNEYVEIAEEDVLRTESLKTEANPLGGTLVWVRRSATLEHTRITTRQTQADFLRGDITGRVLSNARGSAVNLGNIGLNFSTAPCATLTIVLTVTVAATCLGPCPTDECPSNDCPSTPLLCTIAGVCT
jgi:hypothetical protein